jgi:hypothetical protein
MRLKTASAGIALAALAFSLSAQLPGARNRVTCDARRTCTLELTSKSTDVIHIASGNFSADLYGVADTRPSTWGYADVAIWAITFDAPAGYRAVILGLSGDLISFSKNPANDALAPNAYAGVLLGFQTAAPGGSVSCDWCADDTMLYLQDAIRLEPHRAPFDRKFQPGVEWLPGNQLLVKVASYLNTTGKPVHVEATYTLTFVFVKIPQ